jgi:hypothetical protein
VEDRFGAVGGDHASEVVALRFDGCTERPQAIVKAVASEDGEEGDRRICPVGINTSEVFGERSVTAFAGAKLAQLVERGG